MAIRAASPPTKPPAKWRWLSCRMASQGWGSGIGPCGGGGDCGLAGLWRVRVGLGSGLIRGRLGGGVVDPLNLGALSEGSKIPFL